MSVGGLVVAVLLQFLQLQNPADLLGAPGLLRGCRLEERFLGLYPSSTSVWMVCEDRRFLVLSPANLTGNVRIDSPSAALAFVRFFTTPQSAHLFELDGMVEILPGRADSGVRFNEVRPDVFQKYLREAEARELPTDHDAAIGLSFGEAGQRQFEITRFMLTPSSEIVEIEELVTETGYYRIRKKTRSKIPARRLDLRYQGPG